MAEGLAAHLAGVVLLDALSTAPTAPAATAAARPPAPLSWGTFRRLRGTMVGIFIAPEGTRPALAPAWMASCLRRL